MAQASEAKQRSIENRLGGGRAYGFAFQDNTYRHAKPNLRQTLGSADNQGTPRKQKHCECRVTHARRVKTQESSTNDLVNHLTLTRRSTASKRNRPLPPAPRCVSKGMRGEGGQRPDDKKESHKRVLPPPPLSPLAAHEPTEATVRAHLG